MADELTSRARPISAARADQYFVVSRCEVMRIQLSINEPCLPPVWKYKRRYATLRKGRPIASAYDILIARPALKAAIMTTSHSMQIYAALTRARLPGLWFF